EDLSGGAISSEIDSIKKFQSRLEKIQPLSLGFSDMLDYQILASNMKSRLLEFDEIKSYERNPQIYSDLISTNLLQLAMFEYAPDDSRLRHANAKLKLVPRLIDAARSNVRDIPPVFLKIAI